MVRGKRFILQEYSLNLKLWRKEIEKPSRLSMHARNVVFKLAQDQNPKWLWKGLGTNIGTYIIAKRLKKPGLEKK